MEFLNREDHGYPLVYRRRKDEESFVIAINPSNKEQIIHCLEKKEYQTVLQNKELTETINGFLMAPISYWIAKEE